MNDSERVVELVIDSDARVGEGGFLALRRLRLRNRRGDGSMSPPYTCDAVVRPYGQDAVVVVVWARVDGEVRVLVRDGLRPAIALGREPQRAPLPEPSPGLFLTELVAGILEEDDRGTTGLARRAAAEVHEEAGFVVDPTAFVQLGAGTLPSPGCLVEKYYFMAVEVDPAAQQPLAGDGSPMEEGATTRWLSLHAALDACMRGELYDLKTELGLRRLREAAITS
jgi:ADP-ribose pyrophosphatase